MLRNNGDGDGLRSTLVEFHSRWRGRGCSLPRTPGTNLTSPTAVQLAALFTSVSRTEEARGLEGLFPISNFNRLQGMNLRKKKCSSTAPKRTTALSGSAVLSGAKLLSQLPSIGGETVSRIQAPKHRR